LCVGHSYVEHFEPVYLNDLDQLHYWRLVPYECARNGAMIGMAIGVIAIAIINDKLLKQRVVFLHKKGNTDRKDIAQALGKRVKQIERIVNKLIEKGII
jgi:hypothetical protein